MDSPDFNALELPNSPNYYLVCPQDYCSQSPHQTSRTYSLSWNKLKAAWDLMIKKQPRVKHIEDSDSFQSLYVQRTPILRFPDFISVRFIPLDPNSSTIAVLSRSKYGHSDFGVNKKRVKHWLQQLDAEINQAAYRVEAK